MNPLATTLLDDVQADTAILGATGVHAQHGVTNVNLPEAEVKRRMVAASARRILVADSSKIGQVHVGRVATTDELDELITDDALEPARLRARGGVAIAQIAGVATLSLLAWAAHTLLTPTFGFWETFAAETTAAIALGGFGSLLLLLLPIGGLPGRELYAISRGGWAVVALTSASITGAIVASGASFPLLALGLIALGIAAVLTALTVWVRWVAPALDS